MGELQKNQFELRSDFEEKEKVLENNAPYVTEYEQFYSYIYVYIIIFRFQQDEKRVTLEIINSLKRKMSMLSNKSRVFIKSGKTVCLIFIFIYHNTDISFA